MQFWRRFIVGLGSIVLLALSVAGLVATVSQKTNEQLKDFAEVILTKMHDDQTLQILILIFSAMIVLICLSVLFTTISFPRRERTIILTGPHGEVRVTLGAIEDFIKMLRTRVDGVKEMRPKVFIRATGLKIYIKVWVWSDTNIHETTSKIQDIVKQSVFDTLGITEVAEVRVLVVKIFRRENKPEAEEVISRPRYFDSE